ncbi:outer membrane protein OmpA-like peptidoglycan-associated protein [Maribacter spongiicola]|uniref:Outer membrane protein OmpA-like peptidoglycan-associated protein n=1 Tax=Maribacter spongiicola TaxID=1206753 RepID=A0A4R7JX37_9FLAO|nr:OmpA family protein [Maribacter spongiicola]TDT42023.1 outer membrane protein OmpA-like peptidoglycan-associated protein [Maribacter spongiicola]
MTKTTTYLLLMLITIVVGTFIFYNWCSECATPVTPTEPATEKVIVIEPSATSYPFAVDGNGFAYNTNDNYNFNISSHDILMPLSAELTKGVSGLQSHLESNGSNVINVTGYYTSEEENNTAFPNLGLARANSIKNDLASKGFSTAQINTQGKLMDEMTPKDGTYWGAASFGLEEISATEGDDLKALYDKIKADPLVLYFDSAEASIHLDAEQKQKIADISRYLDKVSDATSSVVGHTDATGQASTNMRLGQDRAEFAKNYLMQNGIAADKIIATSKGQTQPIATNATEEGRVKNRRTVITLN